MGAIASGGVRVVNENVLRTLGIPAEVVDRVAEEEERELKRREREYRDGRPPVDVRGRADPRRRWQYLRRHDLWWERTVQ